MKKRRSRLIFALVAVLWGASYAVQKPLLDYIDPVVFTFWNFFLSGVLFLIYSLSHRLPLTYRWREGVVLGLFLSGIEIFQMIGLNLSNAANTAFLTNLGMLLIPFAGWFLFRDRIRMSDSIILGIAIVGMYLLVGGIHGFGLGEVFLLLSALSCALYFLYSERFEAEKGRHISALCVQQFFIISLVSFAWGSFAHSSFSIPSSVQMEFFWQIILFTTVPYAIIQWACIYADEMTAAIYDGIVEPLTGAIFPWIIFLEATSTSKVAGGALMLVAFALPIVFTRKRRHFLKNLLLPAR